MKKLTMGGMFVGSIVGGYIPLLWGNDAFLSLSGIICSATGGLLGIWIGYRLSQLVG